MSDIDDVLPEIYAELKRMASAQMRGQRRSHTLQATALVHEAYLKLARGDGVMVADRRGLLALAGRAMRQVLVDHARSRRRDKRGASLQRVALSDAIAGASSDAFDLVRIGEALDKLEGIDERQVRIVELRFLSGFDVEEAAEILGISPTLVKRETALARAWLLRELA